MNAPLKVLMLGWEYPPNISGGLAVACEGLTKGLSNVSDLDIHFVLPKLLGGEDAPHMKLSDSFAQAANSSKKLSSEVVLDVEERSVTAEHRAYQALPKGAVGAYAAGASDSYQETMHWYNQVEHYMSGRFLTHEGTLTATNDEHSSISKKSHYGSNVFEEVANFTSRLVKRYSGVECDMIHAHDWMTYAAGVALSKATGKPLILHAHSLDFDRSGSGRNETVYNIEKMGLEQATAVIAVSHYTKSVVHREYGIPLSRISVVHNGIYPRQAITHYRKTKREKKHSRNKQVLFLGRVTLQKGPDYYLEAAAKVLSQLPEVTFIMAGTGDMLPKMVDKAHEYGIEENVHFAGFLSGGEIEEAFSQSDLYVMPSVSEPFGISALEAISFDTPVLMSKQSGVSEVVQHSLKFDFWDVDKLADLIINGLIHEELREDMKQMASQELGKVRWEASAKRTEEVYRSVAGS